MDAMCREGILHDFRLARIVRVLEGTKNSTVISRQRFTKFSTGCCTFMKDCSKNYNTNLFCSESLESTFNVATCYKTPSKSLLHRLIDFFNKGSWGTSTCVHNTVNSYKYCLLILPALVCSLTLICKFQEKLNQMF